MFNEQVDEMANRANIFPVLGLVLAVAGTAAGAYSSVKQTKAATRAENARRGQEELEAQRERLRLVREARIRRAEVAQAAENQGAAASSGAAGAQASIGTQLQSNLGFVQATRRTNAAISSAQLDANRAGLVGNLAAAGTNLGTSVIDYGQYRRRNAQQERQANRVT